MKGASGAAKLREIVATHWMSQAARYGMQGPTSAAHAFVCAGGPPSAPV